MIVASAATGLASSEHHPLGEVLRELGKLTERDIGRIVLRQRETKEKFGEAAQSLGLVSREDIAFALARQFEYPCARPSDSKLSPLLVTAVEPFGAAAEVFRVLRGNLMLSWFNDRRRSLAVTGAKLPAPEADDERARMDERITILRGLIETLDLMFDAFGKVRTSGEWAKELTKMQKWLQSEERRKPG